MVDTGVEGSDAMRWESDDLINLFASCFATTYQTKLVGGGEEPSYQPAEHGAEFHQIVFTRDYFSSALHEVAHWCVAGEQRRQMIDYGYWYEPDGRDREQQHLFQQVEVEPQALELIFSDACGLSFRPSLDNLGADDSAAGSDYIDFSTAIASRAAWFRDEGLPDRAQKFLRSLQN
ncbi:MAG: elongation factor P hydroxylase, partial [Halieaceae bacterium]